jgi:hypothetical protein
MNMIKNIGLHWCGAGKSQNAALRKVVAQAAKELSSTGEPCCCVCGSGGEPSASSETEEDEGRTLRFTAFTSTSFVDRTIRLSKAGVSGCRCTLAACWVNTALINLCQR